MSTLYKLVNGFDSISGAAFGGGGGGGGGGGAARAAAARTKAANAARVAQAATKANDYCGSKDSAWVPNKVYGSDISQACKDHDDNYVNGVNKLTADIQFTKDVYTQCVDGGASPLLCGPTAALYGGSVMLFGGSAYNNAQPQ